jgi:ribonuclease BN (tRNA processing enzyme)
LPGALIRAGADRLLVDCGEGTQRQLLRTVGLPELDAIFVTHYHADHWLGLPGMLKTFDLRGREKPLSVFGPPGLKGLFAAMRSAVGRVSYPLALEELERHEEVGFDDYAVASFPSITGSRPTAMHSWRMTGRDASTLRRRAGSASSPGPTSAGSSAGRPSGASRRSRSSARGARGAGW